jgi:hypothetical protein
MSTSKTDLDHFLQLRLSTATVAEIDDVIATISQLCGFSRCKFIRYAVGYALDSISENESGTVGNGRSTS